MRKTEHVKQTFLSDLKNSLTDYKSLLKTSGKDFLLAIFFLLIYLTYVLIILWSSPVQPDWWTQEKIFTVSEFELQLKNQEFQRYFIELILLSILAVFLILALFTLIKEWVWKDLLKQEFNFRDFFKFLGFNTLFYIIIFGSGSLIIFISGLIIKQFITMNFPLIINFIFASIILIIILPLIFHFLNFSGYSFVKTRLFGKSFIKTFKSLSQIKKLIPTYLILSLMFLILGTCFNYLIQTKNIVFSLIAYILFFFFFAWQKVYSIYTFNRIYKE